MYFPSTDSGGRWYGIEFPSSISFAAWRKYGIIGFPYVLNEVHEMIV